MNCNKWIFISEVIHVRCYCWAYIVLLQSRIEKTNQASVPDVGNFITEIKPRNVTDIHVFVKQRSLGEYPLISLSRRLKMKTGQRGALHGHDLHLTLTHLPHGGLHACHCSLLLTAGNSACQLIISISYSCLFALLESQKHERHSTVHLQVLRQQSLNDICYVGGGVPDFPLWQAQWDSSRGIQVGAVNVSGAASKGESSRLSGDTSRQCRAVHKLEIDPHCDSTAAVPEALIPRLQLYVPSSHVVCHAATEAFLSFASRQEPVLVNIHAFALFLRFAGHLRHSTFQLSGFFFPRD